MADIIQIQPSIKEFKVIEKTPTIPLSLLSVASFLNEDYDIKIIDPRLNEKQGKEPLKELKKSNLVGLTANLDAQ